MHLIFKNVQNWLSPEAVFQNTVISNSRVTGNCGFGCFAKKCYNEKSTLVAASAVSLYLAGIRTNFASESTIKPAVYFHFTTSKMSEQKIALVVRAVFFN